MTRVHNQSKCALQLREASEELARNIGPEAAGVEKLLAQGKVLPHVISTGDLFVVRTLINQDALQSVAAMHGIGAEVIDTVFPFGAYSEIGAQTPQKTVTASLWDDILSVDGISERSITLLVHSNDANSFDYEIAAKGACDQAYLDAASKLEGSPEFVIGAVAFVAHLANPDNLH